LRFFDLESPASLAARAALRGFSFFKLPKATRKSSFFENSFEASMNELSDYLNDHLAGSVAALELLDRLVAASEGKPLERFFRDLRADIQQDQEQLAELIAKLGVKESAIRKASAWFAEKLSRPTIDLDDQPEVGLFLAFEAIVLGITGKRFALARAPGRVANGAGAGASGLFGTRKTRDRAVRTGGSAASGNGAGCVQVALNNALGGIGRDFVLE
jgi:hypothetical protein